MFTSCMNKINNCIFTLCLRQNNALALQFWCFFNALTLRVRALDASKSQRACIILSKFIPAKVNTQLLIYKWTMFCIKSNSFQMTRDGNLVGVSFWSIAKLANVMLQGFSLVWVLTYWHLKFAFLQMTTNIWIRLNEY